MRLEIKRRETRGMILYKRRKQETGDKRKHTRERRQETGDKRQETRGRRQEKRTGDERQELRDGSIGQLIVRQDKLDRRRDTGDVRQKT